MNLGGAGEATGTALTLAEDESGHQVRTSHKPSGLSVGTLESKGSDGTQREGLPLFCALEHCVILLRPFLGRVRH